MTVDEGINYKLCNADNNSGSMEGQEWIQIENEMSFNEALTDAVSEAHRHA